MKNTKKDQVVSFTAACLKRLLSQSDGPRRAALAELRRGAGGAPGELPRLWGAWLLGMPEEMQGTSGTPSREEWAVYTAITLFAVHQQGHDPVAEPMNVSSDKEHHHSVGTAFAGLVKSEEDRERVTRRFNVTATSADIVELSHYLRAGVGLFRSQSLPLDYARLAGDLYDYQFPDSVSRVRLRWGQDYYNTLDRNFPQKDSN